MTQNGLLSTEVHFLHPRSLAEISLRITWALHPDGQIRVAQAACYRKHTTTCRDVLALIRRHLWGYGPFPTSPTDPGVVLVPRSTPERWALALC